MKVNAEIETEYIFVDNTKGIVPVPNDIVGSVASIIEYAYEMSESDGPVLLIEKSYLEKMKNLLKDLSISKRSFKYECIEDENTCDFYHIKISLAVPHEYRIAFTPNRFALDIPHVVLQCIPDFDKEYFMNYLRFMMCSIMNANIDRFVRIISLTHNIIISATDDNAPSNANRISSDMKTVPMEFFLKKVNEYMDRCANMGDLNHNSLLITLATSPYVKNLMQKLSDIVAWYLTDKDTDNSKLLSSLTEARYEYLNFLNLVPVNPDGIHELYTNYFLDYSDTISRCKGTISVRVSAFTKDDFNADPTLVDHFKGICPLNVINTKIGIIAIAQHIADARYDMDNGIYMARGETNDICLKNMDPDRKGRGFCKITSIDRISLMTIEMYTLDDGRRNSDWCSYIYKLFNSISYYEILYACNYKQMESNIIGYIDHLIGEVW